MGTEFSGIIHHDSHLTETERVSGQLISESLTQEFSCMKYQDKPNMHQVAG
jgi:hypothetical protein